MYRPINPRIILLSLNFLLFAGKAQAIEDGKPLHEVASLGAATSGPLVEALVGAYHKGTRQHFYAHAGDSMPGYLGPKTAYKPTTIKDQPGIFPAPVMGPATLTFSFNSQQNNDVLTPVIVKPDGTVFEGLPMTEANSNQNLVISSPAQTGIYTMFVLVHQKNVQHSMVSVDAKINTQPYQNKSFQIKPFEKINDSFSFCSAEFIYTPL